MAQPPPYTRQANFTDHSATDPSVPHAGTSLDAEFDALLLTISAALANLSLIQRDDGRLRNASVGLETLTSAVIAMFGASSRWSLKGAWVTLTVYAASDVTTHGTGTYVAATAHTAGTFATDLGAGKWILLFDSAGSTPADGSVTTPKLADGAVTLAKLALTALDLVGTIRAQGGIAAGTATVGELLAAKKATGDVVAKLDRATRAQGLVGLKIGGGTGGLDWYLRQQGSSDALELYDGTAVRVSFLGALTDFAGRVRVTADATPTTGAGVGLRFAASIGYLDSYDHDAAVWRSLYLRGSAVRVYCGGVLVMDGSSAAIDFPVEATVAGKAIGYRDLPQNPQDAAYTLALSDRGKHIYSENSAGQTVAIPANATVAFPVGSVVVIVNRGTNPVTINAAAVTLRQAGTTNTGSRTIAVNGLATLLKVEGDEWFISGAGVS